MTTFTNKQMQQLMQQANDIMKDISEGTSVQAVMAEIYVENLEDKTIQQGQVMAAAILDAVKDFDASYRAAQEDLDGFIKKYQKHVDKDKSCVERCNYWLRFSAAMAAAADAMEDGGADADAVLKEIENRSVSEEEANPELEKQLRDKAREILKNSGILMTGLLTNTQQLEQMCDADEAASLLIDLGNEEIEYRAIIAMLAYTKTKTGELENIPVDMNAAQIAGLVCTQVEQTRILSGVGDGSISVELAEILLQVLGTVVLVKLFFPTMELVFSLVGMVFSGILYLPAMLMAICGLIHLFGKASELWMEDSKMIVSVNARSIKAIVKGTKTVLDYVKDKVLPAIRTGVESLWKLVRGKLVTREETAEEDEIAADEEISSEEKAIPMLPAAEPVAGN